MIGAKESEVITMGTLTANLHLMMTAFYKPSGDRYKILCEGKAFPSDQVSFHFYHTKAPLTLCFSMLLPRKHSFMGTIPKML